MLRTWENYVSNYKDDLVKHPVAKQFLDKASGLQEPIGDDELFAHIDALEIDNSLTDITKEKPIQYKLYLPSSLYSLESSRIDPPPSSFVTEAIELDEEEAVPEVEMITTEPKVSET